MPNVSAQLPPQSVTANNAGVPPVSNPLPPLPQTPPPPTGGNNQPSQTPLPPTQAGIPINGQNYVAQPTGGTGYVPYTSPGATAGLDAYSNPTATAGVNPYQVTQGSANLANYLSPAATAGLQAYAQQGQYGMVQDPALAGQLVQGNLDSLLSSDGAYIENARRRGLEQAASSGLRNSTIAAGASQRAAIESSMPILSEIQNLNNMREQNIFAGTEAALNRGLQHQMQQNQLGFTGQQNQFDRDLQNIQQGNQLNAQNQQAYYDRLVAAQQQANQNAFTGQQNQFNRGLEAFQQQQQNAFSGQQAQFDRQLQNIQQQNQLQFSAGQNQLDRTQGVNNRVLEAQIQQNEALQNYQFQSYLNQGQAQIQDWLANNNYTRQFNANLANTQLNTIADLTQMINQYAVDNPEVYTPSVVSGMQNFLSGSFLSIMQQYFPSSVGGGG